MKTEIPQPLKKLTARQEKFAQLVASGTPATQAYVRAGYESKTPQKNAVQIAANHGVARRIAELRRKAEAAGEKKALLTIERKREIAREIAEDKGNNPQARVKAMEFDSKLAGHFPTEELDVNLGAQDPASITEIAEAVRFVSPLVAARMQHAQGAMGRN